MTQKRLRIVYWAMTILLALLLIADGVASVLQVEAGKVSIQRLGFPLYMLTILGMGKLLAAAGILQPRFQVIKEWAYAGVVFNCVGAIWALFAVGDPLQRMLSPIIFLSITAISYMLWKSTERSA